MKTIFTNSARAIYQTVFARKSYSKTRYLALLITLLSLGFGNQLYAQCFINVNPGSTPSWSSQEVCSGYNPSAIGAPSASLSGPTCVPPAFTFRTIWEVSTDGGLNWSVVQDNINPTPVGYDPPALTFTGPGTTKLYEWRATVTNIQNPGAGTGYVIGYSLTLRRELDLTSVIVGTCASTGSIDITVTEAFTPYTYIWSGTGVSVSAQDQTGLTAGNYTVVVSDNNGGFHSCPDLTQSFTIGGETVPPTITGSLSTYTISGCSAGVLPAAVTNVADLEGLPGALAISDNSTPNASLTVTSTDATPTGTCPIVVTRTYTVTDACLNTSTTAQTLQVFDATAPTLITPGSIPPGATGMNLCVAPVGPTEAAIQALYSDACSGPVSVTKSGTPTTGCNWSVTYTYVIKDQCNNTVSPNVQITYTGSDQNAPTITGTLSSLSGSGCDASGIAPATTVAALEAMGVAIADDCIADIDLTVSHVDNASGTCPVVVTRTYTVKDACLNSSTINQTITVTDATPPVITCPTNVTVNQQDDKDPYATGYATATTSGCTGAVTITYNDVRTNLNSCNSTGYILRTWSAKNSCNISSTCTQTITVVDNTNPVITCPVNINSGTDNNVCNAVVNFAPTAVDFAHFQGFENPAWVSGDYANNPSTDWNKFPSNFIRVPSGTNGIISKTGNAHGMIPTAVGTTGIFSRLGGFNPTFGAGYIGKVDVYFDVADAAANPTTYGLDPSLAISNQSNVHLRDFVFNISGDGAGICGKVSTGTNNPNRQDPTFIRSGTHFNITTSGWYTLEWEAVNNANMLNMIMRLRDASNSVVFTETIVTGDNITTNVGGNRYLWFTFVKASNLAIDNTSLQRKVAVVSTPASASTFNTGTTSVSNAATDACGLSSNCSFNITVTDDQDPQITTCPPARTFGGCSTAAISGPNYNTNVTVSSLAEFTTANGGVALDNCGIVSYEYQDNTPTPGSPIVVTRTWILKDAVGNTETCDQTLTVYPVKNVSTGNGYATIQAAVNAATDGNVIELCATSFDEQVLVNKQVTIKNATTTRPVINFTGTPALSSFQLLLSDPPVTPQLTLFQITSPNVTIDSLEFSVDVTKLGSAIMASSATVNNLKVIDNSINPYRSGAGTVTFGLRNAISVNVTPRFNSNNPTIDVQKNTITYNVGGDLIAGNADDAGFRSGVATDEGGGVISLNTITTISHDITARFGGNPSGLSITQNNFNGGGIDLADQNAACGPITVSNNTFTGAGAPGTAKLRVRNNYDNIAHTISSNTFNTFDWGVSLENMRNVILSSNTFNGDAATDRHVVVNTKSLTSNSNTIVQVPLGAVMTSNNFNGTGRAISFLNHDNDNASYGTFTVGSASNENNFASTLNSFIEFDGQTGSSNGSTFPTYLVTGGWPTTMDCWATNLNAIYNKFDVGAGLQLPTDMTPAGRVTLESKLDHKPDVSCKGLITYFLPVHNLTSDTYYLTIQEAINAATNINGLGGDVIECSEWNYNERVVIDRSLTLQGIDSANCIITGTGLVGTGKGILINTGITNVTIKKLTVQNFAGASGNGDAGIYANGQNNTLSVDQVAILNNVGGSGFYANGPVNGVSITNVTSTGHTVGARGIVIWNGLKENITISNCHVYGNNCCGIELQDGAASGVTMTNNNVHNNGDNGMAAVGMQGPGVNVVSGNIVTNNGRYGIEIKNPNGSGANSGAGSIVISNNTVSRSAGPVFKFDGFTPERRDLAGIAVFRRGVSAAPPALNVDVPYGVHVSGNNVSGFAQPDAIGEGYGIVLEGINHTVTGNTLNGNDVGIQRQAGNTPYPGDGDQEATNNYFGRGNSPYTCGVTITGSINGNVLANGLDTRDWGSADGVNIVTNTNTNEPFCTIQQAINDAQTLNTHVISVPAGTYVENVVVNKSLTLRGAQWNVDPRPTGIASRSGGESIILSPSINTSASGSDLFTIAANGVTIDGFAFDGHNPSLSGGTNINGIDIHAARAISNKQLPSEVAANNLIVKNNIMTNFYRQGVYLFTSSFAVQQNNLVEKNMMDNIHRLDGTSTGVYMENEATADVKNNKMVRIGRGIMTATLGAFANVPFEFSNNEITSYITGIWVNNHHSSAPLCTVNNNTINSESTSTTNDGMRITSMFVANELIVTNNTVSAKRYGYRVWNVPSNTVKIVGGTVTGAAQGVYASNYYQGFGNGASSSFIIDNVSITNSNSQGISIEDDALNTNSATISAEIKNTTITGSATATGILVSGSDASSNIHDNHSTISGALIGVDINAGTVTSLAANKINANGTGVRISNGGKLLSATNNFITNNTVDGIKVEADAGVNGSINNNDLSGNTGYGINNASIMNTLSATCNWYGSNAPATAAAEINGLVTYIPYLSNGTDLTPAPANTDGFQPSATCGALIAITSATPTHIYCGPTTGSIALALSGGSLNYTVDWTGGTPVTGQTTTTYTITPLLAGTYTVTVTDVNGSTASTSITVDYLPVTVTTTGPVNSYWPTIQSAINASVNGDVITVCAGTYAENLTLTKQLTINGAKAGVDARGRVVGAPNPATESVVGLGSSPALNLQGGSSGSIIDGFAFIGAPIGVDGVISNLAAAATSSITIKNNYIKPSSINGQAIWMARAITDLTLDKNEIIGSASASQVIFLSTNSYAGLYFTNNNITGATTSVGLFVDGDRNVGASSTPRNPLVQGNLFQGLNVGINGGKRAFRDAEFLENTFSNITLDGFQGGPANSNFARNTFTSCARWGLAFTSFSDIGAGKGAFNSTVTNNFFSSNGNGTTNGDILISATQPAGNQLNNHFHNNSLLSPIAFVYAGTEVINANCNWFGSTTPAAVAAKIINVPGGLVKAPWLINGLDAAPATPGFQPSVSCGTSVTITSATPTHILCGQTIGAIEVAFTGGDAPIDISWTDGVTPGSSLNVSSTYTITALSAGTYTVTAASLNGSTSTSVVTVQYQPVALTKPGPIVTYYPTIATAIAAAANGDVINVCAGTYTENITVNKAITLRGNNYGTDGCNNTRPNAESVIAGGVGTAVTIMSNGVTLDGFSITGVNGVVTTGNTNVHVTNNIITAGAVGVNAGSIATSAGNTVTIDHNCISLTTQVASGNPTVGIVIAGAGGTHAVVMDNNNISGGFYGHVIYGAATAAPTTVSNTGVTASMQGVAIVNALPGAPSLAPSNVAVSATNVSAFVGNHPTLTAYNFHAGVYTYTDPTTTTTQGINLAITGCNFNGTGTSPSISQASAGISLADFSTGGPVVQTVSVDLSTIQNNANRGLDARGKVSATVTNSSFLNNGGAAFASGGNNGFTIDAQQGATLTANNNFIVHPAISSTIVTAFATFLTSNNVLVASNNSVLMNGNTNGRGANNSGGTLTATCNWWGSIVPATNAALMSGTVTYIPWLVSGVDGNIPAPGFQPSVACEACAGFTINATSTDMTCFGTSDGTATANNLTGAITPQLFSWSNGGSNSSISSLGAATYTVTVTNANGCTQSATAVVVEPAVLAATSTPTQPTCFGTNDGVINITYPTGGSGTYEFKVNGGSWSNATSYSPLSPNTYTVYMRDANHTGCVVTIGTHVLAYPLVLSATVNVTQPTCNNVNDGVIAITGSTGGSSAFDWSIDGGSTWAAGPTYTGLAAGSYSVMIRDENYTACTIDLDGVINTVLNNPVVPTVTAPDPSSLIICSNIETNIALSANVPSTFSWTIGATTGTVTGHSAGSHPTKIAQTLVNGSTTTDATVQYIVTPTSILNSCLGATYTITVTVKHKGASTATVTAPFTYTWAPPGTGLTYTSSGTYYAVTTGPNGCDSNLTLNLTITGVKITGKVLLDGPYVSASGLMNATQRIAGDVPETEPYSIAPYVKEQKPPFTGGEMTTQTIMDANNIVDWIYLELRSGTPNYSKVATKRALVKNDGTIVAEDGVSPVSFSSVPSGVSYFISVKHRNHLGVMTRNAYTLTATPTLINFTTDSLYIKPNSPALINYPAKRYGSGLSYRQTLWAGNANVNTNVKYNGPNPPFVNDDKYPVLQQVLPTGVNSSVPSGYLPEDVNMDGFIRYNGTNNDRNVILGTVGSGTPNNVYNQHTPD